jgi:uncharacterized protein YutE (UPF0331/DUF86 family)
MVDRDLVLKKLAFIETCVQDLHRLARLDVLAQDVREERFVVHTLQLAVQAALDAASYVVSGERLGEPETNRQLFELLRRAGWLPDSLAANLGNMAGFRNIVVHGYEVVDLRVVDDIVRNRLGDLLQYCASVRDGLQRR